jgi:drug/metabolite transporter (DMT)-like permease
MTQLEIAALVLIAAVLHAGWNALVKAGQDRVLTMALVTAVGSLGAALAVPFVAAAVPASWPFLLLSGLLHVGYFTFLLEAYRVGELSHIYPVARGTAPLLVAVGAAVFAGEPLGLRQIAGLGLVSVAISSFALERGWSGGLSRSFLFGLGTAVFIGAYTVVDGLGVRLSGHPLGYILWLFVIDGVPLGLYTLATRRARILPYFRAHWQASLAGGVMCATAYGLVVFALGLGAMAYVSALRETGVIFAAVIGSALLRESFGRRRVLAATLVAAGIIIMNLPG